MTTHFFSTDQHMQPPGGGQFDDDFGALPLGPSSAAWISADFVLGEGSPADPTTPQIFAAASYAEHGDTGGLQPASLYAAAPGVPDDAYVLGHEGVPPTPTHFDPQYAAYEEPNAPYGLSGPFAPEELCGTTPPSSSTPDTREQMTTLSALTLKKIEKLREIFVKGLEEFTEAEEPQSALCLLAASEDSATHMAMATTQALDAFCEERHMDPKLQRQKFHELFQNLKRENNRELRFKILRGEITIEQLVQMDAKDLAPEALKRKRETEAEKYFQQQVILRKDPGAAIIRKTHKGLEEVRTFGADQDEKRETPPKSQESSDREREAEAARAAALVAEEVPWKSEMNTLLDDLDFNELPGDEPPAKRLRLGEGGGEERLDGNVNLVPSAPVPGGSPLRSPMTSPAAFAPLVYQPWDNLLWRRNDLIDKLRLATLPRDPTPGELFHVSQRLQDRLQWLSNQADRRAGSAGVSSAQLSKWKTFGQIRHLSASLQTHMERVREVVNISEPPDLSLPPPLAKFA